MPAPVDRSQLLRDPALLDRVLMGLGLHELIADLAQANEPSQPREAPASTGLRDLLGDDEPNLLERGLVALPRARLEELLDRPPLLLELQELLLARGGPYWDSVMESSADAAGPRLSEAQWQERLQRTFARRPKAIPRTVGQPESLAPARRFRGARRADRIAVVVVAVAALGMAAAWYRADSRLATARQQHADETAAVQMGFDTRLVALEQERAGDRVTLYCRVLHELSSLPPPEQLVFLPDDALPAQSDSLPPHEDEFAEEQLPAAEASLVAPGAREQALARVAEALRDDAAAWAELTGEPRRYLEHFDPRVGHGAAMALTKHGTEENR
jgi:hypothetical protein